MQGISPHGKTDPAIAREILRERLGKDSTEVNGGIQSILEAYLFFLREEVETSPKYRVLPGVVSLLDKMISRSDVMLGLATGNIELGARIKLDRAELNRYFTFGGFGSDAEDRTELVRKAANKAAAQSGKPVSPADVLVIGDTPLDIDVALVAGARAVAVATGSYDVPTLLASGAHVALPSFEDLDSTLTAFGLPVGHV